MTDQDPARRGMEYLIGFLSSAIVAGGSVIMMFNTESLLPPLWAFGGLTAAAMVALALRRWFIAIGIFTTLAAVPLLLVGACFSAFSGI